MSGVHPTAIIDSSAKIHESAEIGPYCVIGPHVEVNEESVLINHVCVQGWTSIGKRNLIYPFAVIGADPQDRKYRGEQATCEIGDNNCIREHVTIHRGTANGGGVTRVGNDNLIMVAAHIAHDCIVADETIIANQVMLAGHVCINNGASIGGGAGIHHFTTVGCYSFIGGLARIARDVPPFMIVEGNPAEVRAVNTIAMTRRGFSTEEIDAVKDAFRRLYKDNGKAMQDRIGVVLVEHANVKPVAQLCESIAASINGVHGRAMELSRQDDKRAVDKMAAGASLAHHVQSKNQDSK